MEAVIKSSYRGYRFAAALIRDAKFNPLKLLSEINSARGVAIQFCRPDIVVSERHLVAAFAAAAASIMSGSARSKRIEMEFLLKLAAKTQIQDALRIAGISGNENTVIVAAITSQGQDPEPIVNKVAELLEGKIEPFKTTAPREKLIQVYEIGEKELESVPKSSSVDPLELLVIEKIVSSYIE